MTHKTVEKTPKTPIVHNNRGLRPKNEVSFGSSGRRPTIAIDSALVDWLCLTSKNDGVGSEWYRVFQHHKRRYPLFVQDWKHQGGYAGWVCEGLAWGSSPNLGYMMRGTGSVGNWLLETFDIVQHPNFRVTRIDVRVDVIVDPLKFDLAEEYFLRNLESERPKYRFISTAAEGGQTVYIGSGASTHSARCYDKGAERGVQAGRLWRYEVTWRKPIADQVVRLLKAHEELDDMQSEIVALVATYFEDKNCPPLFSGETKKLVAMAKATTTVQQKITWLERQVRPTVQKLIEGGYLGEVRAALGID